MKIRDSKFEIRNSMRARLVRRVLYCGLSLIFLVASASAQSTDQSFPTAVTSNEVAGKIVARDVGDARLTTYFYVFGGAQGDVFINVKTANLDGDIDVFAAENLRPLTKITVFADAPETETGRVIYLRKPEKLILRVQGRSPNDNPATFSLKFAGSFAPVAVAENAAPELPSVKTENNGDVIVNSVGTIISVKPKPTPAPPIETTAANEPPKNKSKKSSKKTESKEAEKSADEQSKETVAEKAAIEETIENSAKPAVVPAENGSDEAVAATAKKTPKAPSAKRKTKISAAKNADKNASNESKNSIEPNPLENVQLVILFKDGTKIERPMSEVLRVGVDKGVLTLITKDGKIARYSILDVAKMTIE